MVVRSAHRQRATSSRCIAPVPTVRCFPPPNRHQVLPSRRVCRRSMSRKWSRFPCQARTWPAPSRNPDATATAASGLVPRQRGAATSQPLVPAVSPVPLGPPASGASNGFPTALVPRRERSTECVTASIELQRHPLSPDVFRFRARRVMTGGIPGNEAPGCPRRCFSGAGQGIKPADPRFRSLPFVALDVSGYGRGE